MRIVLVSHGDFSRGILQAASMILGEDSRVTAVGLDPSDDIESMKVKIKNELTPESSDDNDILIMSDLMYGSPFNCTMTLMPEYRIRHITGMNLPMVLQGVELLESGDTFDDVTAACLRAAREGVADAAELLDA